MDWEVSYIFVLFAICVVIFETFRIPKPLFKQSLVANKNMIGMSLFNPRDGPRENFFDPRGDLAEDDFDRVHAFVRNEFETPYSRRLRDLRRRRGQDDLFDEIRRGRYMGAGASLMDNSLSRGFNDDLNDTLGHRGELYDDGPWADYTVFFSPQGRRALQRHFRSQRA